MNFVVLFMRKCQLIVWTPQLTMTITTTEFFSELDRPFLNFSSGAQSAENGSNAPLLYKSASEPASEAVLTPPILCLCVRGF